MFGYLKVDKEELKLKHYRKYRTFYCGVCNGLKKEYGRSYCIALTHEAVFLYIFLDALCEKTQKADITLTCPMNPLMRQKVQLSGELLEYVSFINLYLAEIKCRDDFKDDKNYLKKIGGKIIRHNHKFQHWVDTERNLIEQLENCVEALAICEENVESADLDSCMEAMGRFLATVVMFYVESHTLQYSEKEKERIYRLAGHIGRWVYLIDSFDDYEKDIQHDKFNPLRQGHDKKSEEKEKILRKALQMLMLSNAFMREQIKQFKLICNQELIDNYFQFGMQAKVREIIKAHKYFMDDKVCEKACTKK